MASHVNRYDVIVAGGGPAGIICATLLARFGLRVLLFHRHSRTRHRFEVFAPDLVRSLRRLRFPLPDESSSTPCRGILQAWSGQEEFFDYELFTCERAMSVNREVYEEKLHEHAQINGVETRLFSFDMRIQADAEGWQVLAEDRSLLSAPFLVDASGRSGSFLPPQITGYRSFSNRTIACSIHNIRCVRDQDLLMLEATSQGWWYLCQSTPGQFALVYVSDGDILGRGKEERIRHLYESFSHATLIPERLDSSPIFEPHRTFDARNGRRPTFVGPRWLAVGDAAFTADPLSGRGVSFAVACAEVAASAICAFLRDDLSHLAAYGLWCETECKQQEIISSQVYSTVRSTFHNQCFWSRRL
jgi:flavin-dependent dehydrogenase